MQILNFYLFNFLKNEKMDVFSINQLHYAYYTLQYKYTDKREQPATLE